MSSAVRAWDALTGQRPDLTHLHQHAVRPRPGERIAPFERIPEFARKWYTAEHWNESKALLQRLRATNFEECMP